MTVRALSLRQNPRNALALVGLGTAAGIAHAVYRHLSLHQLDPTEVLLKAQNDLLFIRGRDPKTFAKPEDLPLDYRAAAFVEELEKISRGPKPSRGKLELLQARMGELQSEYEQFKAWTQQKAGKLRFEPMKPIDEDVTKAQLLMSQIDPGSILDQSGFIP
jgi:hypothetical protein